MTSKNFGFLLRSLISAGLLTFIFFKLNWKETVSVIGNLHLSWAFAGFLLTPILLLSLTYRWKLFLDRREIRVSFGKILILTWTGQFFNSVLPGSTGGDVFKVYQICRLNPQGRMVAAGTVIADRFSALIALALLLALAFVRDPILPGKLWKGIAPGYISVPMLIAVCLGMGLAMAGFYYFAKSNRLKDWVLNLLNVLREAALDRSFAKAVGFSLVIHCITFLSFFFFARALLISISYLQVLTILPVILFIVLLPITVNGHGLREVATIFFFNHMAISTAAGVNETVVAISIVMVANDLVWNLPAGLWYLYRGNTT